MPKTPDAVALAINPAALEAALQLLVTQQRGITLSGRLAEAREGDLGLTVRLDDALLHLGPAPAREGAPARAPASEPAPEATEAH